MGFHLKANVCSTKKYRLNFVGACVRVSQSTSFRELVVYRVALRETFCSKPLALGNCLSTVPVQDLVSYDCHVYSGFKPRIIPIRPSLQYTLRLN